MKNGGFMKQMKLLLLTCLIGLSTQTWAARQQTVESVTPWSVLYTVGYVDSFQTPTPYYSQGGLYVAGTAAAGCSTLYFGLNASVDDMRMFMNIYLLAKATGMQMKIYYDSTNCQFIQFGINPN
jgi:hypothetical protein